MKTTTRQFVSALAALMWGLLFIQACGASGGQTADDDGTGTPSGPGVGGSGASGGDGTGIGVGGIDPAGSGG
ncbi:MAG TPA: hypothetical protein ENK57_14870, partial [Polyangiaceae bacterium]|nr:hypothetical protein [Polyangiaceae bacterium]